MEKIKEYSWIILAVCLITVLMTGGVLLGREEENGLAEEDMVILKIWGSVPAGAGPNQVIEEFNRTFSEEGIKAEYCYYNNTDAGNQGLESTLLSGGNADVYFSYDIARLERRAVNQMALDLSSFLEQEKIDLAEWYNIDPQNYYIDGKPYGIPTKLDQYGVMVNKDMFDDAGIPLPEEWDYEEFREIAARLTHGEGENKTYGMFFCTQQNLCYMLDFIAPRSMGQDPLYKDHGTHVNFDSEKMYQLVDMACQMMRTDQSAPSHEDSVTQKLTQESMFLTGRCAMTIGPWLIRSIQDTETYPADFKIAVVPYPVADKGERCYDQGGLGDFLSINPYTRYPKEAWAFIRWYTTKGILSMVEGGRIPAYQGFDADEIEKLLLGKIGDRMDAHSAREVLIQPKENYAISSQKNKLSNLYEIARDEFEQILTGKKSVEKGLLDAQLRGESLLQENTGG